MNWIQFGRLIHSIYANDNKLPDLEWIQSLGLLAVKLAQVHALRIDFLSPEKCQHLAKLYRQNTPLASEDIFRLLESNAVAEFRSAFARIDEQPLATASVGQVHRAVLNDQRDVVVKVVKDRASAKFAADVKSLKRLFELGIRFYPPLGRVGDPLGILEDIEELTSAELDLRNEASSQRLLRRIHEDSGQEFDLGRLKFPQIYAHLSNEHVLVSEFIAGPSVDELLEQNRFEYDLLLQLFRIHGFFMFVVGTFHGDLHPGNVLVAGDDFYFIDTAYIGTVSTQLRNGLFDFFEALTRYDYDACAGALHAMSISKLGKDGFGEFKQQFIELYEDFLGAPVARVSLTRKMMETIKLGVLAGMKFDKGMFGIIRSLMYLDGMVLRCNPDAVLIRDMRPYVEEMLGHVKRS